jgi:hypothetical protein
MGMMKLSETHHDVGLRLPNGTEVWPPSDYKGFLFSTPEERGKLLEVLIQTEADLNLPVGSFVQQHSWMKREWKPAGAFPIDDSELVVVSVSNGNDVPVEAVVESSAEVVRGGAQ